MSVTSGTNRSSFAPDEDDRSRSRAGSSDFVSAVGEMGSLIRAMDWSKTPIGPIERWSQSLRTMVSFMLANRFPLLLWWGPEYISIYNDPYRPVLGAKHPWALGTPVRECWSEIWDVLKPLIDTPFHGGPATWIEDLFLEINRYGFVEETHFTVAYSPVPDESAPRKIGGVLATVHEITEKIVGERRTTALRDLGAHSGEARSAEEACSIAAGALRDHRKDVPFAIVYLMDESRRGARLAAATGVEPGEPAAPVTIAVEGAAEGVEAWPLSDLLGCGRMLTVEDLARRFAKVPPGPWSEAPHQAVVVPIKSTVAHQLAGFLVAGVSPRLRLDDQYRSFFELVASQIATAIATARAYEEERKRAEALAEIDRAKTLFFSNVSHEFRTPLTLMLGPLEDVRASTELDGGDRERLDVAHRNSLRLLKLVNSLLDFSRIEAGRAQASYEPTDLAAFTSELASNFRSACERAGLRLVVDCPPLPARVHVDRDMWEKIVLNLLSNAFKFTFEGAIAVGLRAVDGCAQLSVRDTGVGIPEAELPRLFERFHRIAGQKSRTYEGSGIGLALVQELVRLHGGTIRAESEPGGGTAFTLSIPFGTAHLPADRVGAGRSAASTSVRAEAFVQEALRWLPDASPSIDPTEGAEPPVAMPRGRVLLADDNADVRAYVRSLLAPYCEVEAVPDGEAALQAIRERRPDLVIADVMMPRLDGFGLVRVIRNDQALRDLSIILLSARAGEESRVEGLEAGADDYLVKPFSAREFIARVSANLKLNSVRRQGTEALRESERRYRDLLEALPAAIYTTDASGLITYYNQAAVALAGRRPDLASDRWCVTWKLYRPDGAPLPYDECPMALALKENRPIRGEEAIAERPDGTRVTFIPYPTPLHDQTGKLLGAVNMLVDITGRKNAEDSVRRNEAWLAGQKEAFQAAMDGAPLATSLGVLIRTAVEQADSERRCAFYLVNDAGTALHHVVGMSDSYARCVDGFAVSAESVACGLAVKTGQPVITPDVFREPRWKPWLWMAEQHDYRACWSFPVETAAGKVVGSFAMYFTEPRDATPRDLELVAALTHSASIIISRHQEAEERARAEAALQAELAAMQRLHALSVQLMQQPQDVNFSMREVLAAVQELVKAEKGTAQLRTDEGTLNLVASIGFDDDFIGRFQTVGADDCTTWAETLRRGERILVKDLKDSAEFAGFAELLAPCGVKAAMSTPLHGAGGSLLGVFTTYWSDAHQPSERELRVLDLYAQQAARQIDLRKAEQAVRYRGQQFETLLNQAPLGVYLVDADFRIRDVNPVAQPVFGDIAGLIGRDFDEVIHRLWPRHYADEIVQRFRHTLETGESYETPERIEQRLDRKTTEYHEWRIDRIQLPDGRFGVVCYFRDIFAQVAARERLKLLIDELNHRVKNTLAAVQSIALQTLRNAPTTAQGREALEARLLALASAHDVLTRGHWEGANIREVVAGALSAYGTNGQESRLNADGPDIRLLPKAALALSMALHELATNAAKYGALSNGAGHIEIDWNVTAVQPSRFSFRWTERGGPPVEEPKKRGFGSRLIEQGLAYDIDGDIRLDFARSGLVCTIAAPMAAIRGNGDGPVP